jgi:hypothetical protein
MNYHSLGSRHETNLFRYSKQSLRGNISRTFVIVPMYYWSVRFDWMDRVEADLFAQKDRAQRRKYMINYLFHFRYKRARVLEYIVDFTSAAVGLN